SLITDADSDRLSAPTAYGAGRLAPNLTAFELIGVLDVQPSFEAATDGDDYIEGNGGKDVIFGNHGQDDIIGGSSDLFNLLLPTQRPDNSDLIFGGAGRDISRNHPGDAVPNATGDWIVNARGHALDSDSIIGDNGRILRLVGITVNSPANPTVLIAPVTGTGSVGDVVTS